MLEAPTSPAPAALASDRAADRRRTLRLFGVLLLLTFALRVPGFVVDVFNSDESYLATQAEVINEGGRLYHDATDRKPPLVPYLYATTFTFFSTTALWSVRLVAALAVAVTALLLAIEARRRWGDRAGWIAGILFVLSLLAFAPQDGQAANFEVFMLPFATAAVLLAARGRGGASGVAVAFATLAKQTGAATMLPVAYLLWRAGGRRPLGRAAVGFAVPLIVVALLVGPGDLVFWAVLGNGSYAGLGAARLYVLGLFLVMTLSFVACQLPILWTLPKAWREHRSRDDADLWLWLASSCVAVSLGFRFFGHYYFQLLPPLVLLSAAVLSRMSRVVVTRTVAAAGIIAVVFTGIGFFAKPFGGTEPRYESVSLYLRDHARRTDRILVWGHVPEIYWASGQRPATRFLTTGFLTGHWGGRPADMDTTASATPGAWQLFFEDLKAHPPEYLLDTSPAAIRGSEYYPISHFPQLERIVAHRYRFVQTIDGISIYRRRGR